MAAVHRPIGHDARVLGSAPAEPAARALRVEPAEMRDQSGVDRSAARRGALTGRLEDEAALVVRVVARVEPLTMSSAKRSDREGQPALAKAPAQFRQAAEIRRIGDPAALVSVAAVPQELRLAEEVVERGGGG